MDNWLIFQNGIHAIGDHWEVFLVVLASLIVASWFVANLLQQLFNDQLDQASRLALGLGGGILTLILLAVPVILTGVLLKHPIPHGPAFGVLLLGLFLVTLFMHLRRRPRMMLHPATISLIILLTLLLFIRMAFIAGLELPLYTDGVEHFLIARDLLHPTDSPQAFYAIERLLERYYHLGFHLLVVWVSALSGETVNGSMLVLGQLMQAVIPAALYFPVKAATRSDAAALSAVLLAGLGWTMPAFASNWSKYPALTGLAGFPVVLALLFLGYTARNTKTRWWILLLTGISTFLAALAHTRGIIILFIGLVSLGMAKGVAHLPLRLQRIAASLLTLLTLLTGYLCSMDPDTAMVLSPYLREGMVACILVLVLLPFALYAHPAPVTLALSFGLLVLTCLWVPLPPAFT